MTCPPARSDRGSVTLFVMLFSTVLIVLVGLVFDGGAQLRAGRDAARIAGEAARAGAGQLDRSSAYQGGRHQIDPAAAAQAARAFIRRTGHTGSVDVTGPRSITVTVHVDKPATLLKLIGVGTIRATQTTTAEMLSGIETPQP